MQTISRILAAAFQFAASRFRFHMVGVMSPAALAFALAAAAGSVFAADDTAMIAKAREEARQGKFLIMVSSPKGEDAQRAIMDTFQKRFDLKLDWEWLPLTSPVSGPRMVEQAKAKVRLPSAIGGYPYTLYETWITKNGLDMPVDWVGEFAPMFPTIRNAAVDTVLPRFQKRLLRQWDVQYVMVYNTKLVKPNEVPTSLMQLTEPQWRGKFGMSNVNSSPLDFIALDMGVDGVIDFTKKLLANQPRFKPGPPAVVGAVASGEIAVALAGYTALAESQKKLGAPVAWVALDKLPIQPLFVFMLKDAPQPTLGKLFLAWLVTEGLAEQEKGEALSFFTNKDSPTTKAIRSQKPNVKVVEVLTDKDLDVVSHAEREVMKVISGAVGK